MPNLAKHGAKKSKAIDIAAASARRQRLGANARAKIRQETLTKKRGVRTITLGVNTKLRNGNGKAVKAKDMLPGGTLLCSNGNVVTITAVRKCLIPLHKVTYEPYLRQPSRGQKLPWYTHLEPLRLKGDITIALQMNTKPTKVSKISVGGRSSIIRWKLDSDGLPCHKSCSYSSVARRNAALVALKRASVPLKYETTVETFCNIPSLPVHEASFLSLAPPSMPRRLPRTSLRYRMKTILNVSLTGLAFETLLHDTAWMLGLWLSDGYTKHSRIGQIGYNRQKPRLSHTPVLKAIKSWIERVDHLTPRQAAARINRTTTITQAHNIFHIVNCGFRFKALLEDYGFIVNGNPKSVPAALLTDELEVRRHLLCGIVDGDGHMHGTCWEISVKPIPLAKGFMELAKGLGLATSTTREGHRSKTLTIRGLELANFETRLRYKRCTGTTRNQDCVPCRIAAARKGSAIQLTLSGPRGASFLTADYLMVR